MIFRRFIYGLKEGGKNIFRHKLFSFASIGTIVACVLILGISLSVILNARATVRKAEKSVGISAFFEKGIKQKQKDNIGEQIKKIKGVESIKYISAEEAWEKAKKDMFANDQALLDGFEGKNPLNQSDSYLITLKKNASYGETAYDVERINGIRQTKFSEVATNGMQNINRLGTYLAGGLIIVLLLLSVFLVSNTVALGVRMRKEEIEIMRYIGAANGFIRAPFRGEGIMIGLIGAIIPTGIIWAAYDQIVSWISDKFHTIAVFIDFVSVEDVMIYLIPVSLIVGVIIGLMGSSITIGRYIKA